MHTDHNRKLTADRLTGLYLTLSVVLAGCDQPPTPGPEIHDLKYVAIGTDGNELPAPATDFPCVLDRFTGLTWERKTDAPGLHDWRNTYSWYDPGESTENELDYRGTPAGGVCTGSVCDTHNFPIAVNAEALCGYTDWRVPSRDELATLSDPRRMSDPPTTNPDYFPLMQAGEYWSANDYSFQWNTAWLWNFEYGHDRVEWKASPRYLRLVRGEALYLEKVKE